MRLIDADKAIQDYAKYGKSHSYDASDLEEILNECPTEQAVPIEVLRDIRGEIDFHSTTFLDGERYIEKNYALDIIDKHLESVSK